ncbi:unnamed protein product, partial [Cuscuta europaea]
MLFGGWLHKDVLYEVMMNPLVLEIEGYDGASNMRGVWNGLKALFLNDCPSAYYVHCLAHRLQLALVAASREEAQALEIARMLEIGELETGRGLNQVGTLQRAGETRWSSHFSSVFSLIRMFAATCSVLEDVEENGNNYSTRGDATGALKKIKSFDFVFLLHLIKQIMGITDLLCQHLQKKSQDIVNAM